MQKVTETESNDHIGQVPELVQLDTRGRSLTPERLKEILAELAEIGRRGEQGVNLSEFVSKDRLEH